MSESPAIRPLGIKADRASGVVTIEWADGHVSRFEAVALRQACPCAFCSGEAGRPGWLDTNPTLTSEQTRLADVRLVGSYALAPIWGDGHDSGYFTFESLRDMCPCLECVARRRQAD
jgi:DUF971 family protein